MVLLRWAIIGKVVSVIANRRQHHSWAWEGCINELSAMANGAKHSVELPSLGEATVEGRGSPSQLCDL